MPPANDEDLVQLGARPRVSLPVEAGEGRRSAEEIGALGRTVSASPVGAALLAACEGSLLLLNDRQQIVAANSEALSLLGAERAETLLGACVGEVVRCVHVGEGGDGCGTAAACAACGVLDAIISSARDGGPVVRELWLTTHAGAVRRTSEYRARAARIEVDGTPLTAFVLTDITKLKWREILDDLFLHDIANLLNAVMMWSNLLKEAHPSEEAEQITRLGRGLQRELEHQRSLVSAERGDFVPTFERVSVTAIFDALSSMFQSGPVEVETVAPASGEAITTDPTLLVRVLQNMVSNAIEASAPGGQVRVEFERRDDVVAFCVRNAGEIPPEVASSLFRRPVSTKRGRHRGLGTYSMKLFGEGYLGGRVSFRTGSEGTVFEITLPDR